MMILLYMINYVIRQPTAKEIFGLNVPLPTLPRKTKKKVRIWKRDA